MFCLHSSLCCRRSVRPLCFAPLAVAHTAAAPLAIQPNVIINTTFFNQRRPFFVHRDHPCSKGCQGGSIPSLGYWVQQNLLQLSNWKIIPETNLFVNNFNCNLMSNVPCILMHIVRNYKTQISNTSKINNITVFISYTKSINITVTYNLHELLYIRWNYEIQKMPMVWSWIQKCNVNA